MANESGKVFGIGETVYDIIFKDNQPQRAVPGGSTFNALVSLGRLGVPCSMVTEVGDDRVADIIYKYLKDNGVDTQYVCRHKGTKSHLSLAFLNENNDADYTFYKDYARVRVESPELGIGESDFVLFGSYFAINPAIRPYVKKMLRQAYEAGAYLYYDLNFRSSHIHEIPEIIGSIEENMRMSSVVRGSLDDFMCLYGTDDVETIYVKHIKPHCSNFICTNGSKKIYLRTPSIKATFPVEQIETVSTIGAGDNFNAGFIFALRHMAGKTLQTLSLDDWTGLIDTGQLFAQDVCRQFNNSVSESFAQRMRD
jgi:fructokinase